VFIEFDLIFLQECPILLLKSFLPMMLLLGGYIYLLTLSTSDWLSENAP